MKKLSKSVSGLCVAVAIIFSSVVGHAGQPQPAAPAKSTPVERQAQYEKEHFRYTTGMAKSHKFFQGTEGPRVKFRHIRPVLEQSEEAKNALRGYRTKRVFENIFKVVGVGTVLAFLGMNLADAVGLVPLAVGAGSGALLMCLSVPLMVSANKDQAEAVDAYNRHLKSQLDLPQTETAQVLRRELNGLDSKTFKLSYTWTF